VTDGYLESTGIKSIDLNLITQTRKWKILERLIGLTVGEEVKGGGLYDTNQSGGEIKPSTLKELVDKIKPEIKPGVYTSVGPIVFSLYLRKVFKKTKKTKPVGSILKIGAGTPEEAMDMFLSALIEKDISYDLLSYYNIDPWKSRILWVVFQTTLQNVLAGKEVTEGDMWNQLNELLKTTPEPINPQKCFTKETRNQLNLILGMKFSKEYNLEINYKDFGKSLLGQLVPDDEEWEDAMPIQRLYYFYKAPKIGAPVSEKGLSGLVVNTYLGESTVEEAEKKILKILLEVDEINLADNISDPMSFAIRSRMDILEYLLVNNGKVSQDQIGRIVAGTIDKMLKISKSMEYDTIIQTIEKDLPGIKDLLDRNGFDYEKATKLSKRSRMLSRE